MNTNKHPVLLTWASRRPRYDGRVFGRFALLSPDFQSSSGRHTKTICNSSYSRHTLTSRHAHSVGLF